MASSPKVRILEGMRDQQPALGEVARYDVAPVARFAWWDELKRWVWRLRYDYAYLWPDEGKVTAVQQRAGVRVGGYRPGWPSCWFAHRGLVESLVAARSHQTGLLRGAEWAGGARGWAAWDAYVQESIAVSVRAIGEQCEAGHVDKAWLYRADYEQSDAALGEWLRAELDLPAP